MKKILIGLVLVTFMFIPSMVFAKEKVTIHFFRAYNCTHCESSIEYMEAHQDEIPEGIEVVTYEVRKNANNEKLHQELVKKFNLPEDEQDAVPFIVIGEEYQLGMDGTRTDFEELMNKASAYLDKDYTDVVEEAKQTLKKEDKNISFSTSLVNRKISTFTNVIVFGVFGILVVGFIWLVGFSGKKQ